MIRLAELNDLDGILEIYNAARSFMQKSGNETQWGTTYPPRTLLEEDIHQKQLYVCFNGDTIYGVFVFVIGDDPVYARMENGAWENDSPYGAIHRVAADGTVKGVFSECLAYCKQQIGNIRIDTHENNLVMQHLFAKHGFLRRGTIYLPSGAPRIAYELDER